MLHRTRRGEETRERLLELAEAAVLQKGFAATPIDEPMAAAGVEGGIVNGKVLKDETILPNQVLAYREFIRQVFAPER